MDLWLESLACAAIIFFSGCQLSKYGDAIADKSGLARGWIGLILLATVTSLPEMFSSISAVTLHDLPDMAVSGLIGSCMFNMMVVGMLDVLSKGVPVSNVVHKGHILSAGFGIVLMGFVAVDILFGKHLPTLTWLHNLDPISIAFVIVYFIAMRLIFRFEQSTLKESIEKTAQQEEHSYSWSRLIFLFGLNALFIVGASCYLPELGDRICQLTGWGESFVGSSFIAITTSLPEIAVSVSAARRNSFDMAVANLLGSNLFNIALLAITDFCYLKEPLMRHVSLNNCLTALTAIISMGIVVVGLSYRAEKKLFFLAGDAVALILVYLMANALLFTAR